MGDIRQTEVCRTFLLPDSQIKRQHVNRFAAPGPIQQLRVSQSPPDIRRHRFENRRLLLRLRTPGVAVSIVTAVHQFFEEAGRLGHNHALNALFSRNLSELFGDLNCLIKTAVLVNQSPFLPLGFNRANITQSIWTILTPAKPAKGGDAATRLPSQAAVMNPQSLPV